MAVGGGTLVAVPERSKTRAGAPGRQPREKPRRVEEDAGDLWDERATPGTEVGRRGCCVTRRAHVLACLALAWAAWGCAGPLVSLYPPPPGDASVSVWVVRHTWHTGLVVRRADVAAGAWPARADFPGAAYLEVGWGDRDFYQAPEGTLWLALKAALWPTDSVLHVAAFAEPPERFFAGSEVVSVRLSARGFQRFAAFVADAHARDDRGRAIRLGPGKYGASRFYLGRERYLLTTCNVWTARALRAAGLPITPAWALTAGNVMFQVRRAAGVAAEGGRP